MADIGRRLWEHRRIQGISREKLSEMTSLDVGTISRVEHGRNCYYPTVNVLREALKMTHEDLEHDILMGAVQDIHPGGSAESQKKTAEERNSREAFG